HIARVAGFQVAVLIVLLHDDGGNDRRASRRVARLNAEGQMVGRARADSEAVGSVPREAGSTRVESVRAGRVENQVLEGSDPAADGRSGRADAVESSRSAGRYGHPVGVMPGDQITEWVEHLNLQRRS